MSTDRRQDFHDFGGVAYFNCATQGPMPRVALDAVRRTLEWKATPHLIGEELYFAIPDAYRRAVAGLIGAEPASIAVTDSTTQGIMLVVNGLDWRSGDEVVIPGGTFPANRFPWLWLERRGVRVVTVPEEIGGSQVERFAAAITPRTRVVSIGWVGYSRGLRYDLAGLGELCRQRGILFVVDGTQGAGGLELDLRRTPCDLLACSAYKWMLGPYGVGFAYVAPELAARLTPANVNWMAIAGAEDFNRLADRDLELVPEARRFDRNEAASFFDLSGATAAAVYLTEVTPAAIERHVRALLDRLIAGLPAGWRVVSPLDDAERANILSIAGETPEATANLFARLTAAGIRPALRENAVRFSPNIYNTEEEIDRALERL